MQARMLAPSLIPQAWPLVVGWVTEALTKGKADERPDEILARLLAGKQQLWLAWDGEAKCARGICVTEVFDSARGKACNLAIIAGRDFKTWRHLTEAIKGFARTVGCVRLEFSGRKGWERLVGADGWNHLRTILEMRLDNEQQQEQLDKNL